MNLLFYRQKKKFKMVIVILLFMLTAIFTAYSQTLGDVNTDGTINIVDALMTAQYYVGLNVPNFNAANADVDGNGSVQIIDALMIAQYYVGLITSFPAGGTRTPSPTPGPSGGRTPKAAFTISNITPALNETVTFNAAGSSDPDGSITGYAWNFGDDTTATGMQVTHAFTTVDDYKVALTVTDSSGLTAKLSQRVFIGRPQGWTQETHHKSADANYTLLFPEDRVLRMDITINNADYRAMEADVARLNLNSPIDPMYVPVTVKFNNYTWWNVGMRYKGNSSLYGGRSEAHKYPFRLNFDKYEDDHPEISNQRFYGFQEMTFCNSWNDMTLLREKICSDIFRNGGLATAKGSFCRVFIDTGSGPVYWGLYTMVEDVSDQMLKDQFPDDAGNLYKPTGTGADWTSFSQTAFAKKTNEEAADWSDVLAAYNALHASRTNAAAWRAGLEAVFKVDIFLRWLAINTTVSNWDSYGLMAQNYYLYQDLTDNGRLHWIPWDHNLSLTASAMVGRLLSYSLSEVTNKWPLIRYLMDDPVYKAKYNQEMLTALNGCFDQATVTARIQYFANLIKPYVVGTEGEISGYTFVRNGETGFNQAVTTLINHIGTRQTGARNYLNTQ